MIKFNFIKCSNKKRFTFIYVTIFDFLILATYMIFFYFNKYTYYGPEAFLPFKSAQLKHLDLHNCLSIITVNNENQLLLNESFTTFNNLELSINTWNIQNTSYVIIEIATKSKNLETLFFVMDMLGAHNIPNVYISTK